MIRGAGTSGVDPELLLAMMIQEGDLSPRSSKDEDYYTAQGHKLRELAGNASRVGPQPLERLIQAYNGLGSPAAAFRQQGFDQAYGGQDVDDLPENFYGHAVMDVRDNLVRKSPEIQGLLDSTNYKPRLAPLSMDEIDEVGLDLDRQRRQPSVTSRLRNIP